MENIALVTLLKRFYIYIYIPGGCLGFLNHQQYLNLSNYIVSDVEDPDSFVFVAEMMWSPLNLELDSWLGSPLPLACVSALFAIMWNNCAKIEHQAHIKGDLYNPKELVHQNSLAFTRGNLEGSEGNLEFSRYDMLIYMMIYDSIHNFPYQLSFHGIYCSLLFLPS